MIITDDADCEDLEIHGTIQLESNDTTDPTMMAIEKKAIEELKKKYEDLLKEFPGLKISLNSSDFKDGWIEYSLETEDHNIIPVNVWKQEQGVGLIPTPEQKVGADIY